MSIHPWCGLDKRRIFILQPARSGVDLSSEAERQGQARDSAPPGQFRAERGLARRRRGELPAPSGSALRRLCARDSTQASHDSAPARLPARQPATKPRNPRLSRQLGSPPSETRHPGSPRQPLRTLRTASPSGRSRRNAPLSPNAEVSHEPLWRDSWQGAKRQQEA